MDTFGFSVFVNANFLSSLSDMTSSQKTLRFSFSNLGLTSLVKKEKLLLKRIDSVWIMYLKKSLNPIFEKQIV